MGVIESRGERHGIKIIKPTIIFFVPFLAGENEAEMRFVLSCSRVNF
jgi:hypothetical protein